MLWLSKKHTAEAQWEEKREEKKKKRAREGREKRQREEQAYGEKVRHCIDVV